jgi:hypothetical protein
MVGLSLHHAAHILSTVPSLVGLNNYLLGDTPHNTPRDSFAIIAIHSKKPRLDSPFRAQTV